jgi:hypothetical protein
MFLAMVVCDNKSTAKENAGESMAIMMVIAMQRCEATGCLHWASACTILPQQPPWSKNSNKTNKTLTKNNF